VIEIEGASSINVDRATVMGCYKVTNKAKRAAGIIVDRAGIIECTKMRTTTNRAAVVYYTGVKNNTPIEPALFTTPP
jgi:hypothetical protein